MSDWNGNPWDDPARQRADNFYYDTLEDWEQRGLVNRVIRPSSATSGQPESPSRTLQTSSNSERPDAGVLA